MSMVIIVGDSILWNSKTRKMTPFEVITTQEGKQHEISSIWTVYPRYAWSDNSQISKTKSFLAKNKPHLLHIFALSDHFPAT